MQGIIETMHRAEHWPGFRGELPGPYWGDGRTPAGGRQQLFVISGEWAGRACESALLQDGACQHGRPALGCSCTTGCFQTT